MPVATIENAENERIELKTLKGAFVELRVMPYSKWLKRQELALNIKIETAKGTKDTKGEMAMANAAVTLFEFKNAIVDHNLTNEAEEKLNFANPVTFELLDTKIGNEIAEHIMRKHEFMTEEGLGN